MSTTINIKKLSAVVLSLVIFFALAFSAVIVFAQPTTDVGGTPGSTVVGNPPPVQIDATLDNPFGGRANTLFELLRIIIDDILLPIGGVLAVLSFIYSGLLYVTAQGNETKIKSAHQALLYTSVGTAILLGSWVIAQVIENTINQLK